MKLPTVEQIAEIILAEKDPEYTLTLRLRSGGIGRAAENIVDLLKRAQFEETPKVDPNLVRIAQLEAKLYVYESVIGGAGIKLGMPVKKTK